MEPIKESVKEPASIEEPAVQKPVKESIAEKPADAIKEVLKEGDGKNYPKKGDTVHIHYKGTLTNGIQFDSSYERPKPFATKIDVGQVISGWDELVPKMSLGEKARLIIPSHKAYGERGFPHVIPPNATLVFEMELLQINDMEKQKQC